jgi:hypothetical protein
MSWRLAESLVKLRDQVNAAYPGRNKASDGTIGDAAHAATVSDHNPNSAGVVTAFDITHDPAHGLNIWDLANDIREDNRVKYLIANNRIWIQGGWEEYTGVDPHTSHLHVSVTGNYDDPRDWAIKEEEDMYPNRDQAIYMFKQLQGKEPTEAEIQHFQTIQWWPLFQALTGDNPGWIARTQGRTQVVSEIEQVINKYK